MLGHVEKRKVKLGQTYLSLGQVGTGNISIVEMKSVWVKFSQVSSS